MNAWTAPAPSFSLPISSGILAHCRQMGIALWVFLWMIDRTTREVPTADGHAEGLVYGGKAIRAREIAEELGIAPRTVHAHIEQLIAGGYLRRIDHGLGMPSGYSVVRSKKWKNRSVSDAGEDPSAPSQDSADLRRQSAGGSPNPALPSQNSALPSQNSAPYKEDNTKTIQGLNIVEETCFDETPLPRSASSEVEKALERRVKEGWDYYLERTGKSEAQYAFSSERKKQGLKGFQSLAAFATRCGNRDPEQAASELFRLAVDRLAGSAFHNGKNPEGKRYLDWHQLFRGKDHPSPTKLLEVWLDDARWAQ